MTSEFGVQFLNWQLRGVLQKFCVANPFSAKNQRMDLKPKKLYSPGFNLLFDIIAVSSEAFFISIDEFVHACSIPHELHLFDGLLLRVVLVHPALNLCTHCFTVSGDNILLGMLKINNFCYRLTHH